MIVIVIVLVLVLVLVFVIVIVFVLVFVLVCVCVHARDWIQLHIRVCVSVRVLVVCNYPPQITLEWQAKGASMTVEEYLKHQQELASARIDADSSASLS